MTAVTDRWPLAAPDATGVAQFRSVSGLAQKLVTVGCHIWQPGVAKTFDAGDQR